MLESPRTEIALLARKDVLSERFRHLLGHALSQGLLVGVARAISCWACQIQFGLISITLIAQRQSMCPQRKKQNRLSLARLLFGNSSFEVQKPCHPPAKHCSTLARPPVFDESGFGLLEPCSPAQEAPGQSLKIRLSYPALA